MVMVVFGAQGNVGRHVVAGLRESGHQVRATSRDPRKAMLPPGSEVMPADLDRPETLPPVLEGADGVFLYARPDGARGFVDAAEAAGVRRVVLLSSEAVVHDGAEDTPIARQHRAVELALEQSTLSWTFLRPGLFAANTRWCWRSSVLAEDVVRLPYPDAQTAPVHEKDLAALAVTALTHPGHESRAYTVYGPQSLTLTEQVRQLGDARGRDIAVEVVTPEQARVEMSATMPSFAAEAMINHWAAHDGIPAEVSTIVEDVTGHPAHTFADWATDHAAEFRSP